MSSSEQTALAGMLAAVGGGDLECVAPLYDGCVEAGVARNDALALRQQWGAGKVGSPKWRKALRRLARALGVAPAVAGPPLALAPGGPP